MHIDSLLPSRLCGTVRVPGPLCPVLSLGADMDGLGLIWTLSATVSPHQRHAFALAVHASGGLSLLVDADRGFLSVERIARCTAALTLARTQGAYRTGYAFAQLVEALGYGERDTRGFELLDRADCGAHAAFVAGFGTAVAQSLETDVMRVVGGTLAAPVPLVERLRCWIDAHGATDMLGEEAMQEALWQP